MPLKIQLLQGDITQLEVEAIVNSANNDFILGSGVSGAIHRLGGPEIQEECHKIGTRPLGSVATTTAGKLKARYIIHAAVNPLGLWADAKSIRSAFRGVLRELREKGIKSAAVPAIGTGAGAFNGLEVSSASTITADTKVALTATGTSFNYATNSFGDYTVVATAADGTTSSVTGVPLASGRSLARAGPRSFGGGHGANEPVSVLSVFQGHGFSPDRQRAMSDPVAGGALRVVVEEQSWCSRNGKYVLQFPGGEQE